MRALLDALALVGIGAALITAEREACARDIEAREPIIGIPKEWHEGLTGAELDTVVDLIRHAWDEAKRDYAAAIRQRATPPGGA